MLPSEGASDAVAFLERAYRWYAQQGITVESVMTDNGSAYRSARWREACVAHAFRHLRTRPYTPRTNGKAERFIQTLLRELGLPLRLSLQPAPHPRPFRLASLV